MLSFVGISCFILNEFDNDIIMSNLVPDYIFLSVGNRCYLETNLTNVEMIAILKSIKLI